MTNTLLGLLAQYWYVAIVAMLMVLLSIAFFVQFVFPAIRLSTEIDFTNAVLKDIRLRTKGNVVELSEIESKAMSGATFSHLWSEYSKTLHPPI